MVFDMKNKYCLAYTTTDSKQKANEIAQELIKRKLAACCSIITGVQSVYYWDNQICEDEEFLLMIKTTTDKIAELKDTVLKIHNYDLPELIVVPVTDGNEKYLNWIDETVKGND